MEMTNNTFLVWDIKDLKSMDIFDWFDERYRDHCEVKWLLID